MIKNYEFTHRRKNLLNGEWVLVSPHRNNRPWLGATEAPTETTPDRHDPSCPLCPNNTRANGDTNPNYEYTHAFINDFGALTPTLNDDARIDPDELFEAQAATGEARVICFSPEHNKTLPELSVNEISKVVTTWQQQFIDLSSRYSCIHIFENKGEIMGCSQPHPHGQIWAHNHRSTEIQAEDEHQLAFYEEHKRGLLAVYIEKEQTEQQRIVIENEHWIVVVPYWAKWPFETLLICKDTVQTIAQLDDSQSRTLAKVLKELTIRYDNVFNCSFPYSMGWHNAPLDLKDAKHWRLHAHFYPPLLRSASVKKHMVGYEMLAESQRDLTAETAAKILRDVPSIHYKD
ncbi:UDP-glucose--hexose-1-phosphate uridylyltransferase [Brumicola pallidula]|jgi:UDPglucose--hexose-1-phosphate uridylyltransferase|uniref:Galactose-1-phosphate uridylyltransferase n=1 Tax=Brumicola pallidula DSM 14239 = ACAM 615 TaxID=1121922 RepID=K6ZPL6_9ALTE|nr:UDPglucose--hexose-1-phosphate uridylyltransferase [Glaciecola pallidula DSM 14239 = ACAM 615]